MYIDTRSEHKRKTKTHRPTCVYSSSSFSNPSCPGKRQQRMSSAG
jgi:hypothetical protein